MRHSNRDYGAGEMIGRLREDRGMSRRDLVQHMHLVHPDDPRMQVSERTLARIEDDGAVPTARVKFAIAQEFEMVPSQLWGASARRLEPVA